MSTIQDLTPMTPPKPNKDRDGGGYDLTLVVVAVMIFVAGVITGGLIF